MPYKTNFQNGLRERQTAVLEGGREPRRLQIRDVRSDELDELHGTGGKFSLALASRGEHPDKTEDVVQAGLADPGAGLQPGGDQNQLRVPGFG